MDIANEILDAIEIIVNKKIRDNTAQIYRGVCKGVTTTTCTLIVNGKDNTVKYYGGTPTVGAVYQIFVPSGDMSMAFVIVPGTTDGTGESGVSSVNGKTGNVILNANDVGALSSSTIVPSKTSQLDNDSGFIDDSALSRYAKTSEIPTQTSQLTNNSGFITSADVPTKVSELENDRGYITDAALNGYAKTNDIPTKVSQLNNDLGYVDSTGAKNAAPVQSVDGSTGIVVTNAVKTITQTLTATQKAQARTNIGAGTSSFDGSYNSLNDKPTIPTQTSQLTNDSGFITDADAPVKSVNGKTGEVELSASDVGALTAPDTLTANQWLKTDANKNVVLSALPSASTGARGITYLVDSYTRTDTDKAVTPKALNKVYKLIPEVTQTLGSSTDKVPSEKAVADAISSAGGGDMLKATYDPTGAVETAGGIPAYVEANGGKIDTIKVNGTAQTITNKTVDIAVPTNNNQLTNGAGYITASDVPVKSVNSKTGNVVLTATDVGALSDTTIIPVVNDATLNVQRNGVSVGTFTANASTDKTINIAVPTKASDVGALPDTISIPSKTSELDNDSGFITSAQVPVTSVNNKTGAVALTKSDVGLGNVDNVKQYSASNPPPYPVTSVNGKTGDITISAGIKIVTSASQPTNMNMGDFWYQEI